MLPSRQGAFHLFRAFGIDVFLHWSWFVVAVYEFQMRQRSYTSPAWNVIEYLGLFVIVTLHEFGHSLACRQVGGQADQIVLWPLGGVAYVAPPQRPGAQLWSIAAGPLVNVLLAIAFYFGWMAVFPRFFPDLPFPSGPGEWLAFLTSNTELNLLQLFKGLTFINFTLLLFNLVPVYPLDGGQILRSLLWYPLGKGRSLQIAAVVGIMGALGLGLLAFAQQSIWLGLMTFFMLSNSFRGWRQSQALVALAAAPRRRELVCPSCHESPPAGALWLCVRCQAPFDPFAGGAAVCGQCQSRYDEVWCLECGTWSTLPAWGAVEGLAHARDHQEVSGPAHPSDG